MPFFFESESVSSNPTSSLAVAGDADFALAYPPCLRRLAAGGTEKDGRISVSGSLSLAPGLSRVSVPGTWRKPLQRFGVGWRAKAVETAGSAESRTTPG